MEFRVSILERNPPHEWMWMDGASRGICRLISRARKHNSPSSLLPLPCFLFTILPLCALCCSCPMWRQDEQHAPSTKHQPELDLHSENAGKLLNPGRIPYTSEHGPHGAPSTTSKINITFCEADISEGSNTFTLLSCF